MDLCRCQLIALIKGDTYSTVKVDHLHRLLGNLQISQNTMEEQCVMRAQQAERGKADFGLVGGSFVGPVARPVSPRALVRDKGVGGVRLDFFRRLTSLGNSRCPEFAL